MESRSWFEETLEQMNEVGGFRASILASSDGLPIATVPSDYDTDTTAAMVAVLTSVAEETQARVGLGLLDEVAVMTDERLRLVCRHFVTGENRFILAVLVPPDRRYRRMTNWAIREIKRVLLG